MEELNDGLKNYPRLMTRRSVIKASAVLAAGVALYALPGCGSKDSSSNSTAESSSDSNNNNSSPSNETSTNVSAEDDSILWFWKGGNPLYRADGSKLSDISIDSSLVFITTPVQGKVLVGWKEAPYNESLKSYDAAKSTNHIGVMDATTGKVEKEITDSFSLQSNGPSFYTDHRGASAWSVSETSSEITTNYLLDPNGDILKITQWDKKNKAFSISDKSGKLAYSCDDISSEPKFAYDYIRLVCGSESKPTNRFIDYSGNVLLEASIANPKGNLPYAYDSSNNVFYYIAQSGSNNKDTKVYNVKTGEQVFCSDDLEADYAPYVTGLYPSGECNIDVTLSIKGNSDAYHGSYNFRDKKWTLKPQTKYGINKARSNCYVTLYDSKAGEYYLAYTKDGEIDKTWSIKTPTFNETGDNLDSAVHAYDGTRYLMIDALLIDLDSPAPSVTSSSLASGKTIESFYDDSTSPFGPLSSYLSESPVGK